MRLFLTGLLLLATTISCVEDHEPPETGSITSEIATPRLARVSLIRSVSREFGVRQGSLLIAGVANAETGLAHCWHEAQWACQGPVSADCGWGPVISGAGDGPCRARQGGLGLFQFDGGNHDQTLARDGQGILSLHGNVERGVSFILDLVVRSPHITGVTNPNDAIAFLNRALPGTTEYDQYLTTIVHLYNGCRPGACGVFWSRYDHYDEKTRALLREFRPEFWSASGSPPSGASGRYTVPAGGSCSAAAQALECPRGSLVNCTSGRGCEGLWAGDELACERCDSTPGGSDGQTRPDENQEPPETGRTYVVPSGGSCWTASETLGCPISNLVNCTADRSCEQLWRGDELSCSASAC